jgi:phage terminase large subunit
VLQVNLNDYIPDVYSDLLVAVNNNQYNQFVLKGGRGSVKSTVAALLAVLTVRSGRGNAVCIRRYATTLKGSCYNDVAVAIERLGIEHEFDARLSPMEFRHIPTGHVIMFRGLDDPTKLKSIRAKSGNFAYLWFEECSEIEGMAKCRNVIQSVGRGRGSRLLTVFTFNPPSTTLHWVNSIEEGKGLSAVEDGRYILHTSYLDIDPDWLGELFLENAAKLMEADNDAYLNEYLGKIVNARGTIFKNVKELTPDMEFDRSRMFRGIDFGFTKDPSTYVVWAYDKRKHAIFLVHELYEYGLKIEELAAMVTAEQDAVRANWVAGSRVKLLVYCDCAEPRSVQSMVDNGVKDAVGCSKGPDSVRHGIKWLQSLTGIYIPKTMANGQPSKVYEEFDRYQYPLNKNGEYVSQYPDKDNHTIDSTRYALQDAILGYM